MSATYLQRLFGLENQVIVVIGGTGVLGGALAQGISEAGAHVVVAGRSRERGELRVDAIKSLGGKASFTEVDAGDRKSMQALLNDTVETHGRVHAVVNCAGVNAATPYFDIEDDEFERIVRGNLYATHIGCQIFGKHMVDAGGGAILNIGSVTSYRPLSRVFTYSATKAAVLSLTQNLAREFAPHKIRVNCLCPGFFPAEQNRRILDEARTAGIMRHTPMHRFGEPSELIGATLLLLSPVAGSYMTGEAIYVDGGFTAMTI